MLCGMTGSGKSTMARRLEVEHNALRLLPDEWVARLGLPERDTEASRRNRASADGDRRPRPGTGGCDVVMEAGFWSRRERDEGRAVAKTAGAAAKVIYLRCADGRTEAPHRRPQPRPASPTPSFVEPGELDG